MGRLRVLLGSWLCPWQPQGRTLSHSCCFCPPSETTVGPSLQADLPLPGVRQPAGAVDWCGQARPASHVGLKASEMERTPRIPGHEVLD